MMGGGSAMALVFASLLAMAGSAYSQAAAGGGSETSSPYYVIPAAAQAGSNQPYARGCQVSTGKHCFAAACITTTAAVLAVRG